METNLSQRTRDAGVFHERLRGASEAPSRSNRLARELVYPVRDEEVRLVRVGVVPIGWPHQSMAVGTEHRKAVKGWRRSYLFQPRPIRICKEQIEVAELWIGVMVRGEDDFLAIGCPRRAETGGAQMRDLTLVAPIGIHDPEIHLVGAHQTLGEEILVG